MLAQTSRYSRPTMSSRQVSESPEMVKVREEAGDDSMRTSDINAEEKKENVIGNVLE